MEYMTEQEYITNIVLTAGFAIWTLMPMYTKYMGWEDSQKSEISLSCVNQDANATKLCECVNDTIFKNYTNEEYVAIDKNSTQYVEFEKETKEDCLDDSWF